MFRSGKHTRSRTGSIYRRPALAVLTAFMLLTATVALADNVQNDVAADTGEIVTIAQGDSIGATVNFRIAANNGDGQTGCNAADGSPASVTISVAAPAVGSITKDPSSALSFSACSSDQGVKFTASVDATPGDYEVTASVTDTGAGTYNTNPAKFTLRVIASTPPDTSPPQNAAITIDDGADWTNNSGGSVTVDVSATDDVGIASYRLAETQAGLAAATAVSVSPTETSFSQADISFTLTGAEGAAKSVWLQLCDGAPVPNCALASDAIGWDKTAPTVAYTSAAPAPNVASWNNTDVVATFTATDNLSGFAPGVGTPPIGALTTTGTATTSGEGASITVGSPAFSDVAGNTVAAESATSAAFKIDKTAPTVAVTGVSNGATYILGSAPTAGCSTVDVLSEVKTAATVTVTGGTVNGVGTFTASCTGGLDNADNLQSPNPVTVSYTVNYGGVSGFLQPINDDNSSVFKRGQSVPGKFRLSGDEYLGFNTDAWTLKKVQVNCEVVAEETVVENVGSVTPSTTFRYDAAADQYIYNTDFRSSGVGTCWKLRVTLDSGQVFDSAVFKLAK